jgi:hypothetical protein
VEHLGVVDASKLMSTLLSAHRSEEGGPEDHRKAASWKWERQNSSRAQTPTRPDVIGPI